MSDVSDKLMLVREKVQQLIEENQRLKREQVNLLELNKQLHTRLIKQEDAQLSLDTEMQVAQNSSAQNTLFEGSNKQIIRQIDKYTKQIDACIDWLQNA